MRIVPYEGSSSLEDLNNLYIIIKAVPFEDAFAPAMIIVSPDNEYNVTLDELNCLMDGIEMAQEKISEVIAFIMNTKTFGMEDD
jgi:hypothetical protein